MAGNIQPYLGMLKCPTALILEGERRPLRGAALEGGFQQARQGLPRGSSDLQSD